MNDLEARTQKELAGIVSILTELTGLPSRWSGRVELVPDAEFKGRTRQMCDIQLDAAFVAQDRRWSTLIHEALHSLSAGYNANDFREYRGWEEGIVEQLQRMCRPVVLSQLGVAISDTVFYAEEESHNFNDYIAALESLRLMLREASLPNVTQLSFYIDLLGRPIKDRPSSVLLIFLALEHPQRGIFIAAFSQANSALRLRTK